MKRSFKAATAFTGAAVCAVAMTPAVGAATVVPETAKNCTAADANWVHLYYSTEQRHSIPACFGNNGANYLTNGQKFSEGCTGNNYGFFVVGGTVESFKSNSLWIFAPPQKVTEVYIGGHTAKYSHTCPMVPNW